MKITYYVATSLDGFIAREDGDVSWLDDINIDMADTGYDDFFASIDGLVMGSNTYDFILDYGTWPYGNKPTWIITKRDIKSIESANLHITKSVDSFINVAKSKDLNHIWLVGGGKLASSFIKKDLLTHLSISEIPVKLISGIPVLSDHLLKELSPVKAEILQKKGFKQIEIVLRNGPET